LKNMKMRFLLATFITAFLLPVVLAESLTPFGRVSDKCVFNVPEDYLVEDLDSLSVLKKIETDEVRKVIPPCSTPITRQISPLPEGWSAWAYAEAKKGITSFNGTWVVPPKPAQSGADVLFLFTGLVNQYQPGPDANRINIIQPVLQWGVSAAGGGAYWSLASWYVDSSGNAHFSPLTSAGQLNPGDIIQGNMVQDPTSKIWTISAIDVTTKVETTLHIKTNASEPWAFVTLEVYSLSSCNDYPHGSVPFTKLIFDGFVPEWKSITNPGCNESVTIIDASDVTLNF